MGGFESFCAMCGASLGTCELSVGPSSESAQRIRKALIRDRDGQTEGDDDSDWAFEEEEEYYDVEASYDPEIMARRDVALPNHDSFIDHVRLVMYDPDIKESSQYFISGEAHPHIYGFAEVYGGHPERPDEDFSNIMYFSHSEDQTKAFPCHGLCLQLAAKVILGNSDSKLLNPEVLYRAMCDDFHGGQDGDDNCLSLNHGDIEGADQYWECVPGYEYCIMNPLEFYGLHMATLVHLTVEHDPRGKDNSSTGIRNMVTDPFETLSNELVLHVANYLEAKDVFRLRQASMIAREATSSNSFWKPRVQRDLAWLWIPHNLFDDRRFLSKGSDKSLIDWMKVYLLFDSVTARPCGTSGVYLGLANRRRIWNTCEELKSAYMSHAAKNGRPLTNPNPSRRTWSADSEIDSLWREALDVLESTEQWLGLRGQADKVKA